MTSSPRGSGEARLGLAALAAIGLLVCCGTPLLLVAGAAVTLAGVEIGSWVLVLVGLGGALFAVNWSRGRHRESHVGQESVDAY